LVPTSDGGDKIVGIGGPDKWLAAGLGEETADRSPKIDEPTNTPAQEGGGRIDQELCPCSIAARARGSASASTPPVQRKKLASVGSKAAPQLTWIGIIEAKTEKKAIEKAAELFKVAANRLIANPTK
jgi:hypothetical protein